MISAFRELFSINQKSWTAKTCFIQSNIFHIVQDYYFSWVENTMQEWHLATKSNTEGVLFSFCIAYLRSEPGNPTVRKLNLAHFIYGCIKPSLLFSFSQRGNKNRVGAPVQKWYGNPHNVQYSSTELLQGQQLCPCRSSLFKQIFSYLCIRRLSFTYFTIITETAYNYIFLPVPL